MAQNHQIDPGLLDKISDKKICLWSSFSREELKHAINKYSNLSASRPNKLSWRYIKMIVKNYKCSSKFINITNAYINLGLWSSHFKIFTTVIISKPNKSLYDSLKSFHLIVLLNILGKLFKKIISE